ncbi:MAG: hypothetical protein IT380_13060 [Myxococcales bacterium]|nr:hypothetical protein [Myxococcales bacterium]
MLLPLLALAALPTPADFLEGSEIGDATQSISLRSKGVYEGASGKTTVTGTWAIKDDALEVKATGCKGPECKALQKDFRAEVEVVAPRAMVLLSTAPAPFLQSGAYYCHYLGCEQRIGVAISSQLPRRVLNAVEDTLIDQNRGRNATVVWVGHRAEKPSDKTRIEVCGRDAARAKKGLELLQDDVKRTLPWIGEPEVVKTPATNCLWDVQLVVSDKVQLPPKKK